MLNILLYRSAYNAYLSLQTRNTNVDGLIKVLGFVLFIGIGYFLKRVHVLKEDTVHALSGLLLYVTLPCLILVCLNGLHLEWSYLWLIGLGLLTNFFMIGIACLISFIGP